jgi:hypothetical protein
LLTNNIWLSCCHLDKYLTHSKLIFFIFAKRLTQSFIQSSKPQFIAPYFLISATNSNMFVATLVLVPTKPFLYVNFFFSFSFLIWVYETLFQLIIGSCNTTSHMHLIIVRLNGLGRAGPSLKPFKQWLEAPNNGKTPKF